MPKPIRNGHRRPADRHDAKGRAECRPFSERPGAEPELPDWDSIIAHVCNRLKGSRWEWWEDDLTMPRLEALYTEWGDEPPADIFVAAYFGYKKPQRVVNAFQMVMDFPGGVIGLG